ncbi:hypothetical protein TNCV_1014511 [Trichonephila clavipes]|uniref:Uncharacterized protein n=1 Tax=Trichonephila clavipes TaxID=2585209 RepID=A0A8X6VXQ3_TRICX|nr:hypothetical protein TNCV_1014511 [Trichonephila clavipes]
MCSPILVILERDENNLKTYLTTIRNNVQEWLECRPSCIVVSDADCGAVWPGFDFRLEFCKCILPSRLESTINSRRAASPFVRLVEGKRSWKPLTTPRVFSLKIVTKPSRIVLSPAWCSKLRLTTGVKI